MEIGEKDGVRGYTHGFAEVEEGRLLAVYSDSARRWLEAGQGADRTEPGQGSVTRVRWFATASPHLHPGRRQGPKGLSTQGRLA